LHLDLHLPAWSPFALLQLSPQAFLQSTDLSHFLLHDAPLHLQLSLQVQLPAASLQVHDVSQIHFPSTAQHICLPSFTGQHLPPANDEKVTAKITNNDMDRSLIYYFLY